MRRRPFPLFMAFVWSFGLTAITAGATMLMARFWPGASRDIVTLGALQVLPLLVGSAVVLVMHLPGETGARGLALRPTYAPLLLMGAALGIALYLPVQSLVQYAEQIQELSEVEIAQRALLYRTDTTARVLLLMLFGACLIPASQEVFFHGAVYGALRREFSPAVSAVVSALAFGVASTNLRHWPELLLVGSVGSYLRATSGSLLVPVTMSVSLNAVTLLAIATHVTPVTHTVVWPWQAMLASWVVGMALVALAGRVSRSSTEAAQARAEDEP